MHRKIFVQLFLQGEARLAALQIPKRQLCGNWASIGRISSGFLCLISQLSGFSRFSAISFFCRTVGRFPCFISPPPLFYNFLFLTPPPFSPLRCRFAASVMRSRRAFPFGVKRETLFFWCQKNQKRGDSDFPAPLETVSQE